MVSQSESVSKEKVERPKIEEPVNELHLARSRFFGEIAGIMSVTDTHKMRPVGLLSDLYFSAFRHGFYRVFYNAMGMPVGYIIWAKITQQTESRILSSLNFRLHISEWNEGDRLWIVDFIANPLYLAMIIEECLLNFSKFEAAKYFRVKRNRIMFREISRDGVIRLASRY